MRTRLIQLFLPIVLASGLSAQEIKPVEPEFKDYIPMLENAGYELYTFDISSLLPKRYDLRFSIRMYNGDKVKEYPQGGITNLLFASDFPESVSISPEEMADPEHGIYTQAKRLNIGFSPTPADSTKNLHIDVENMASKGTILPLRHVENAPGMKKLYEYGSRRFKIDSITAGEFIPLVLFGSYWWDEKANINRFCGERELSADLTDEILKHIPHYYIIGVTLTKTDEEDKK